MALSNKLLYGVVFLTLHAIVRVSGADLFGIGFIGLSVDDLDKATTYYTDIIGGMLVPKLSTCVHRDSHYYRMFQKEILAAAAANVDPNTYGVPNIRTNGNMQVSPFKVYI